METVEINPETELLQALKKRLSGIHSQIESSGYNLPKPLIDRVLSLASLVDQAIKITESGNNLPDNLEPEFLNATFADLTFDLDTVKFSAGSSETVQ